MAHRPVVMPQMYGYKSVKWVTGIEVRTDVKPGYWEQHGCDADAWIGCSTPPGIFLRLLGVDARRPPCGWLRVVFEDLRDGGLRSRVPTSERSHRA